MKKFEINEKQLCDQIDKSNDRTSDYISENEEMKQKYEVFENVYADGLIVDFIKIINKRYPMGSKKRERIKKIVGKIIN